MTTVLAIIMVMKNSNRKRRSHSKPVCKSSKANKISTRDFKILHTGLRIIVREQLPLVSSKM